MDDLVASLQLVEGKPFDQLRRAGYGWLAETPLDHYLTAAVVDVAHIVATDTLAARNTARARWVSQTAISAAPAEDKPRLDLAAAMAAEGNTDDAVRQLAPGVFNRSDDPGPPPDPTGRTQAIMQASAWQSTKAE